MRLRNGITIQKSETTKKSKLDRLESALKLFYFIPKTEKKLRKLSEVEQILVKKQIDNVCSFASLPEDSHIWSLIWKSLSSNDKAFLSMPITKEERMSVIRKKWIYGIALKLENGKYMIILLNLRDKSILRHEIQHVIDDADCTEYVKNILYFEQRSVWVEHQNQKATSEEIELIYSLSPPQNFSEPSFTIEEMSKFT